jgi:hypothetical protein
VSACDSPNQNNISNHVVLQCSISACILTNDNNLRRQLIHKRQHERKCIACVNLHLTIDACQCVTCAIMKRREDFSYQQWSKPNNAKKCLSCVQHLMSDGCSAGWILIREHAMSNRLVDGKLHYVPGKKVKDRAARPSAKDKKEAQQGLDSFDYQFQLAKNSVLSISNLGFDIESYSSFNKMTFILPSASLPIDGVNDFATTIRYPNAIHEIFSLMPVTSSNTSHPMNSFHDSPTRRGLVH